VIHDIGNWLTLDEDSDVAGSGDDDDAYLPPELLEAFDRELPKFVSDPMDSKSEDKENSCRVTGHKRKAPEPIEDDVSG
jgi:hypothetical protein